MYTPPTGLPSKIVNPKIYEPPVSLKIADLAILSLAGSGTNFGLTLVFLKSDATIDTPFGIITPPSALL